MEGLGRTFNIVPTAAGVEVSLKGASAVTFVCTGANAETFTVAEAKDAAGTGAQNLAVVTHYYANASAAGANAWTRVPADGSEQVATAVVTTTTAAPVAVIEVSATALSDGYAYVRVTQSVSGLVRAIVHDLTVQRSPINLPAAAV